MNAMKKINAFFAEVSGILVCIIMVAFAGEIVGRAMGYPIPGSTELSVFCMVAIIFFGLSICEEQRGHVRVEFLIARFPPKLRYASELIVYFLGFCIYALLAWYSGIGAISSWSVFETVPGLVEMPVYPSKTAIPIGCGLMCIQIIFNAIILTKNRAKASEVLKSGEEEV